MMLLMILTIIMLIISAGDPLQSSRRRGDKGRGQQGPETKTPWIISFQSTNHQGLESTLCGQIAGQRLANRELCFSRAPVTLLVSEESMSIIKLQRSSNSDKTSNTNNNNSNSNRTSNSSITTKLIIVLARRRSRPRGRTRRSPPSASTSTSSSASGRRGRPSIMIVNRT